MFVFKSLMSNGCLNANNWPKFGEKFYPYHMIILSASILNFNIAATMQQSDRWKLINKRRLCCIFKCVRRKFPIHFKCKVICGRAGPAKLLLCLAGLARARTKFCSLARIIIARTERAKIRSCTVPIKNLYCYLHIMRIWYWIIQACKDYVSPAR